MPVAIEVPGLDFYAPDVPDGRVVILEGDAAPAKGHLAQRIARTAAAHKRPVTLVTTRGAEASAGVAVQELDAWPDATPSGRDLVVDSFSLLALDASPQAIADRVRSIRRDCRQSGHVAILVLDDGQLGPAARAACHHLADGIIQFRVREDADGPVPYLRIPKWMDGGGTDKNLFYGFDGRQILIDTRRRVN